MPTAMQTLPNRAPGKRKGMTRNVRTTTPNGMHSPCFDRSELAKLNPARKPSIPTNTGVFYNPGALE